jgi:hypothetical protein
MIAFIIVSTRSEHRLSVVNMAGVSGYHKRYKKGEAMKARNLLDSTLERGLE